MAGHAALRHHFVGDRHADDFLAIYRFLSGKDLVRVRGQKCPGLGLKIVQFAVLADGKGKAAIEIDFHVFLLQQLGDIMNERGGQGHAVRFVFVIE